MKKTIKNIFIILQRQEKATLIRLVLFDVAISVLDICFLAALLYVIHFYTEPGRSARIGNFPLTVFNKYPLLLIAVFFILYGVKNLLGFHVFRLQFRFVCGIL